MILMPIKKLFFLSIILIILINPANGAGIREENIWIFQGSYELGINERAYLEGFTVKIHEIHTVSEPTATILIYRNSVFKEAFKADTELNSEHIYDNELRINVIDLTQDKVSLEIYKQKSELVWITDIPKTAFKTGDTLTGHNYRISLLDIEENGAVIKVEHEGNVTEKTYKSGDYEKFSDEFMINVIYIKKDTQEVLIETMKPGSPNIEINTANLQDNYDPGELLEYELIITNTGTIPLHGIILTTECKEGEIELPTQQHSILDPGKMKKFQIKVKPDMEPLDRNITITSKVRGYDYQGREFHGEKSLDVNVNSYISIKKGIERKEKISENPEFGTEQYFKILITLNNKADHQTAVNVKDDLPKSFIPADLDSTEWALLLDPEASRTIEYFASPTEPGDFTFGPASVIWKHEGKTYTLESEAITRTFHVSGSKVVVKKELSSSYMLAGENISVLIRIINDGDRDIEASFEDNIPDKLTYIDGKKEWRGYMEAGETKEFSYTLRAEKPGELYLPATELSINDEKGHMDISVSDEPFLYIDDPLVESDTYYEEDSYSEVDITPETGYETSAEGTEITKTQAAGFLVSSFATLFILIAIVPAFAYLFIIRVYK